MDCLRYLSYKNIDLDNSVVLTVENILFLENAKVLSLKHHDAYNSLKWFRKKYAHIGMYTRGFLSGTSGKERACQCMRL